MKYEPTNIISRIEWCRLQQQPPSVTREERAGWRAEEAGLVDALFGRDRTALMREEQLTTRILVVDDDLDLRSILRDRLMHRGHKRDMIHRAVGLRGVELLDRNSCDRWCRRIMPLEKSAFGR